MATAKDGVDNPGRRPLLAEDLDGGPDKTSLAPQWLDRTASIKEGSKLPVGAPDTDGGKDRWRGDERATDKWGPANRAAVPPDGVARGARWREDARGVPPGRRDFSRWPGGHEPEGGRWNEEVGGRGPPADVFRQGGDSWGEPVARGRGRGFEPERVDRWGPRERDQGGWGTAAPPETDRTFVREARDRWGSGEPGKAERWRGPSAGRGGFGLPVREIPADALGARRGRGMAPGRGRGVVKGPPAPMPERCGSGAAPRPSVAYKPAGNPAQHRYSKQDLLDVCRTLEDDGKLVLPSVVDKSCEPMLYAGTDNNNDPFELVRMVDSGQARQMYCDASEAWMRARVKAAAAAAPPTEDFFDTVARDNDRDMKIARGDSGVWPDDRKSPFARAVHEPYTGDDATRDRVKAAAPPGFEPPAQENEGEDLWHYKDPQGEVQGPFPRSDILEWLEGKFFTPDLPIRPANAAADVPFKPLSCFLPLWTASSTPAAPPGFENVLPNEDSSKIETKDSSDASKPDINETQDGPPGMPSLAERMVSSADKDRKAAAVPDIALPDEILDAVGLTVESSVTKSAIAKDDPKVDVPGRRASQAIGKPTDMAGPAASEGADEGANDLLKGLSAILEAASLGGAAGGPLAPQSQPQSMRTLDQIEADFRQQQLQQQLQAQHPPQPTATLFGSPQQPSNMHSQHSGQPGFLRYQPPLDKPQGSGLTSTLSGALSGSLPRVPAPSMGSGSLDPRIPEPQPGLPFHMDNIRRMPGITPMQAQADADPIARVLYGNQAAPEPVPPQVSHHEWISHLSLLQQQQQQQRLLAEQQQQRLLAEQQRQRMIIEHQQRLEQQHRLEQQQRLIAEHQHMRQLQQLAEQQQHRMPAEQHFAPTPFQDFDGVGGKLPGMQLFQQFPQAPVGGGLHLDPQMQQRAHSLAEERSGVIPDGVSGPMPMPQPQARGTPSPSAFSEDAVKIPGVMLHPPERQPSLGPTTGAPAKTVQPGSQNKLRSKSPAEAPWTEAGRTEAPSFASWAAPKPETAPSKTLQEIQQEEAQRAAAAATRVEAARPVAAPAASASGPAWNVTQSAAAPTISLKELQEFEEKQKLRQAAQQPEKAAPPRATLGDIIAAQAAPVNQQQKAAWTAATQASQELPSLKEVMSLEEKRLHQQQQQAAAQQNAMLQQQGSLKPGQAGWVPPAVPVKTLQEIQREEIEAQRRAAHTKRPAPLIARAPNAPAAAAAAGEPDDDMLFWDYGMAGGANQAATQTAKLPEPQVVRSAVAPAQAAPKAPWANAPTVRPAGGMESSAYPSLAALQAQVQAQAGRKQNGNSGNNNNGKQQPGLQQTRLPSSNTNNSSSNDNSSSNNNNNEASSINSGSVEITGAFRTWCKEQMKRFSGSDDLTFVEYLMTLSSGGEVAEAIQVNLQQSAESAAFTTEFLRRKLDFLARKHDNKAGKASKQSSKSQVAASAAPAEAKAPPAAPAARPKPAPVPSPSPAAFDDGDEAWQKANPGKKQKGKKKGKKVDLSLLGFQSNIDYSALDRPEA